MDTSTLTAPDGTVLHLHRWLPPGRARAVVQIAHGMAEHGRRYAHLGERLAKEGYAAYAVDHRGHGLSAGGSGDLGHLGDDHGFADVVDDLVAVSDVLAQEHPGVPLVLLGHSLGSVLARAYAARYGERLDALILSGTPGDPGVIGQLGLQVARLESRVRGPRARSWLMETLVIGPYNRPFRPNRTNVDWLSRDEQQVDAYVVDELSGARATAGFYRDLLNGLLWVSQESTLARIPPALPVRVVVGEDDPVGGAGAAAEVAGLLHRAGVRDVTTQIWPGARHEVLNEINRDDVENDIVTWLDRTIGR